MPRILVAGLFHETHSFVTPNTTLADFAILRGSALLACRGDASPLGGALEAAAQLGWDTVPAVDMRAMPSGPIESNVVDEWWRLFSDAVQAGGRLDGVFLVLHGAMIAVNDPDVEGTLLARMRAMRALAGVVIGGVTDLHANFSDAMAVSADALVTYHHNPHTDARESAIRAVHLLHRLLTENLRPTTVLRKADLILPPTATATADEPMHTIEVLARALEQRPDVLAANIHAGYAFGDCADTGLSFTAIVTEHSAEISDQLDRMADVAHWLATSHPVNEMLLTDAIAFVKNAVDGPILLVEPSDNIGGGAPGDGAAVLKALIAHDIARSVVVINDPEAVQMVSQWTIGHEARLSVGGKRSRLSGGPCIAEFTLVSLSDGEFTLEDPHSHLASMMGSQISMGPCAVVRHRGVTVLLTSRKTPPFDLGQLRSQGIEPTECLAIAVKAAVAHRRAYDPIAKASMTVATPGPCASDLSHLPYRLARR